MSNEGKNVDEILSRKSGAWLPRGQEALERQEVRQMTESAYGRLLHFLGRLEEHRLSYTLDHVRAEAIMVIVSVPGERWEIEFLDDSSLDVERFRSTGEIEDERALDHLFAVFTD